MTNESRAALIALLGLALAITGCGTVKEKTAPCKRPASILSYASEARADGPDSGCGPMRPVNSDPDSVDEAIDLLTSD